MRARLWPHGSRRAFRAPHHGENQLDFALQFPPQSAVMKKEPFFAKQGDAFVPNPVSNGPWNPDSMHGRVVIGLLAHVIEARHSSPEFVPARLTVDMFRLPDIHTPVKVETTLV